VLHIDVIQLQKRIGEAGSTALEWFTWKDGRDFKDVPVAAIPFKTFQ